MSRAHQPEKKMISCCSSDVDNRRQAIDVLAIWLVDDGGNVAMSHSGLALLGRIERLAVPAFASTEEAIAWGVDLNAEERATLFEIYRVASNAAQSEENLQRMVYLATQAQLLREAACASVPRFVGETDGSGPQGSFAWDERI